MARRLAPSGKIHVIDFGDCAGLPTMAKSVLHRWLDKFGVEPRRDLQAAMRAIAQEQHFQLAFTPLYRGYAQYGVLAKL